MHDTPSQSERSFLLSAECACASLVAHGALLLVVLVLSAGGRRLPAPGECIASGPRRGNGTRCG